MKLTIEIDDKHTGDLLQFLASLKGKQVDPEGPTQRVVPIPDHMHPLPPLPDGYSHWVGRSEFSTDPPRWEEGRVIRFWFNGWIPSNVFHHTFFHIEAV